MHDFSSLTRGHRLPRDKLGPNFIEVDGVRVESSKFSGLQPAICLMKAFRNSSSLLVRARVLSKALGVGRGERAEVIVVGFRFRQHARHRDPGAALRLCSPSSALLPG